MQREGSSRETEGQIWRTGSAFRTSEFR